ncbi:hypothetical protein KSP39_PZI003131 [Platanthera zijinensis]|uniref:Uncharacterized protein n=1 Tax=Platanthera zijinensis TaxID=2320716 RepID=A0AAP0BW71_9ASPA
MLSALVPMRTHALRLRSLSESILLFFFFSSCSLLMADEAFLSFYICSKDISCPIKVVSAEASNTCAGSSYTVKKRSFLFPLSLSLPLLFSLSLSLFLCCSFSLSHIKALFLSRILVFDLFPP